MGRTRQKKKGWIKSLKSDPKDTGIPIKNLPEKFLLMRVKSGTKIRNVLGYALKEFSNYEGVVWTAIGQGIGKAISCAELFKRKQEGLHQITKLRYVESKKSTANNESSVDTHQVPEIYILLSKVINDTSELGYQAPGDNGEFLSNQEKKNKERKDKGERSDNNVCHIDAEEFAAMGLRTGQKRAKKERQMETPSKKNKKEGKDNR